VHLLILIYGEHVSLFDFVLRPLWFRILLTYKCYLRRSLLDIQPTNHDRKYIIQKSGFEDQIQKKQCILYFYRWSKR
jgi:hypothetical protein